VGAEHEWGCGMECRGEGLASSWVKEPGGGPLTKTIVKIETGRKYVNTKRKVDPARKRYFQKRLYYYSIRADDRRKKKETSVKKGTVRSLSRLDLSCHIYLRCRNLLSSVQSLFCEP